MSTLIKSLTGGAALIAATVFAGQEAAPRFEENWESIAQWECPEWYQDAKLGIFIHWGPYAVPAYRSEWYPRLMYMDEKVWSAQGKVQKSDHRGKGKPVTHVNIHHVETHGSLDEFGYKDFIPQFRAERFDASEWLDLFEKAGAKYIVPVAEHHDGFAMYASNITRWNSVEMGPKRDILGELAAETRKRGLKFGASSHFAFNWSYYNKKEGWDSANPAYRDLYGWNNDPLGKVDEEFQYLWWSRTKDIIDSYEPDVLWFDFFYDREEFRLWHKKLAAYYYNQADELGKEVAIQSKNFHGFESFPKGTIVLDLERGKMADIYPETWQTDTSIGANSWGYIENWISKTPDRVVDNLVDIVSKNGCLLLNVGPRSDGTIPEDQEEVLLELGAWLETNGEAIYETRPWKVFGEGPTEVETGHHSEAKNKDLTGKDFRFTQRDGIVYAIAMAWPKDGKGFVRALGTQKEGKIESVELLGSKKTLSWTQEKGGLELSFPKKKQGDYAHVFRVTFE